MSYLSAMDRYQLRVVVRKIRSIWVADCPACPMARGFVTRPTQGLALAWALSHVADHRKWAQNLINVARGITRV